MTKHNLMNWCYKFADKYASKGNHNKANYWEFNGDMMLFKIPDNKLNSVGDEPTGKFTEKEIKSYFKKADDLED